MGSVLEKFVAAFIDFGPGLLVASVHGPATGISFTTLPLCDAAYASDSSRFTTPFTRLSQVCKTLRGILISFISIICRLFDNHITFNLIFRLQKVVLPLHFLVIWERKVQWMYLHLTVS